MPTDTDAKVSVDDGPPKPEQPSEVTIQVGKNGFVIRAGYGVYWNDEVYVAESRSRMLSMVGQLVPQDR